MRRAWLLIAVLGWIGLVVGCGDGSGPSGGSSSGPSSVANAPPPPPPPPSASSGPPAASQATASQPGAGQPDAPQPGAPPAPEPAPGVPPTDNPPPSDNLTPEQLAENALPQAKSESNLKKIASAMQQYLAKNQKFPPAASYGPDNKPLLSWRVYLLPYMGMEALYKKFKLDEPWNSPNNIEMVPGIPDVYRTPLGPGDGRTCYLAPIGPVGTETVFSPRDGMPANLIGDGKESTILVAEVDFDRSVNWTEPGDLRFNPDEPTSGLGEMRDKVFLAVFGDGAVRRVPLELGREFIRALFTANGKERVELAKLDAKAGEDKPGEGKPAETKPKEGYMGLVEAALDKQEQGRALLYLLADAVVRGSEEVLSCIRWCPALKRPVLMVRLGFGLQAAPAPAGPASRGAAAGATAHGDAMRMWSESVGMPLLAKIQEWINAGKFGRWMAKTELKVSQVQVPGRLNEVVPEIHAGRRPPRQAPQPPLPGMKVDSGVTQLGSGEQGKLRAAAIKEGLDAFLMVVVTSKPVKAKTGNQITLHSTIVIRAIDAVKNEVIWSSTPVTASADGQGGDAKTVGQQAVNEVQEYIEKSLMVTDMPALTPEAVQARADVVSAATYANPLPALTELRYYQYRKLLTAEEIGKYFAKIIGEKDGPVLASGPEAERKQIVEKWIGQ